MFLNQARVHIKEQPSYLHQEPYLSANLSFNNKLLPMGFFVVLFSSLLSLKIPFIHPTII